MGRVHGPCLLKIGPEDYKLTHSILLHSNLSVCVMSGIGVGDDGERRQLNRSYFMDGRDFPAYGY